MVAIARRSCGGTVVAMSTNTDERTTLDDAGQQSLTELAHHAETHPDPLVRLDAVRALREALAGVETDAVRAAREASVSWTEVGRRLGVSKQAAAKRFTTPARPPGTREQPEGAVGPRARTGWVVTTPGGRPLLRIVSARAVAVLEAAKRR